MIPYILHASILMAGCYIFYWLLLRQETFFKLNRGVLIACLVIPMILPLITIPASWAFQINPSTEVSYNNISTSFVKDNIDDTPILIQETKVLENVPTAPIEVIHSPSVQPSQGNTNNKLAFIKQLIPNLYLTGVIVFALAFLIQLLLILAKIASLNSMQDGKYKIVELVKDEAPYSFWNTIFINPTKYDPDTYQQILAHEKIHIDQTHFVDMLLVELSVIAFWFNPFVWLFRKAITNNLEFLTDESMLTQGFPKQSYQMSLLKVSVPQYPLNLTTNYNQSFLKNRIAMMNTKRSSARSIWKYLFILPLLGFSVMSLNAVRSIPNNIDTDIVSAPKTMATADIIPTDNVDLEKIEPPTTKTNTSVEEIEKEEIPTTEENKQLKEEVMKNLRNDGLLDNEDPVFKLFPNKILLNEKPLNSKLRKKYKAIFQRHGITANKSRLLVVDPLVIMSGTFVGNQNVEEGQHVDIFDEEENQDDNDDEVTVHTVTTTTTNDSTGDDVSVTTIEGRTYVKGKGVHYINGKKYTVEADEVKIIEEDGSSYTTDDLKVVEKALRKAHDNSHSKQVKKAKRIKRDRSHSNANSNSTVDRHSVITTVNGETTESFTINTENGKTYIYGNGTHVINGSSYANNGDKVMVIESDGSSYFIENSELEGKELRDIWKDHNNNPTNKLTGEDRHYLDRSNEAVNYDFVSAATLLRPSTNELYQLPQLCNSFYSTLEYDNIISNGNHMVFYLGQNGAFVNGHHLSSSKASEFIALAKQYGYTISSGFNIQFDGKHVLLTDEVEDLNHFRKDLLNLLKKDGFISNKKKKMVMQIYGNRFSVNGEEIPNNKLTKYFQLFKKHRVTPAPGKIIETETKRGKLNTKIGYTKDGSMLGTFAIYD